MKILKKVLNKFRYALAHAKIKSKRFFAAKAFIHIISAYYLTKDFWWFFWKRPFLSKRRSMPFCLWQAPPSYLNKREHHFSETFSSEEPLLSPTLNRRKSDPKKTSETALYLIPDGLRKFQFIAGLLGPVDN
ncbi:hypothetical protein GCM10011332_28850 [Terasakiella brassicae]|uniref:Uncharacterized protein n=1 Tax=Terasakiella brassicae TaxID=1634917 RepID=A0A917FE95_9PROT|nr:hypothetical protein [Terasakiella brassicae]GGF73095.1 hypothetical protein GCM10011332_28850 [Terasakiella brassicae]